MMKPAIWHIASGVVCVLYMICGGPLVARAQRVGIGAPSPDATLHLRIPVSQWITQLQTSGTFEQAAFIGLDPNGAWYLASGAYRFIMPPNIHWTLFPNQSSLALQLNQSEKQIEMMASPPNTALITRLRIDGQARVGIGVNLAQQTLSVAECMAVDQGNTGNGFTPTLRLGSASGEGFGSRRTPGEGQFSLSLNTASLPRMQIGQNGKVATGDISPQSMLSVGGGLVVNQSEAISGPCLKWGHQSGVAMGIGQPEPGQYRLNWYTDGQVRAYLSQAGNLHLGNTSTGERMNVDGNLAAGRIMGSDLQVDRLDANQGTWAPGQGAIRLGDAATGEGISSQRVSGERRWGISFFTASQLRMHIGNLRPQVDISGNLTVQNGKGILRSTNDRSEKMVVTSTVYSRTLTPFEAHKFTLNFAEPFSAPPDVWVINRGDGAGQGGWAEVNTTLTGVTTTQCDVWVYNTSHQSKSVNFVLQVAAMGRE